MRVLLDTFHGLPTHALIVHFTVVALPTAAIGGILVALVPWLRRRYGLLVGLVTLAACVAVPFTVRSGQDLYTRQNARFGPAEATEAGLMQRHRDLALALPKWTVLLLVGVFLVVVLPALAQWLRSRGRSRVSVPVGAGGPAAETGSGSGSGSAPARAPGIAGRLELADPDGPSWQVPVALVGVVLTLVGGVMTLIMVARVGEAGARAAWQHINVPSAAQPN
jgi:hypothetical protein